jgi:enoyl-CoA hydratase
VPIDVVEHPGRITRVVVNNPAKRNALDEAMYRHLARLWPELAQNSSFSSVVLMGAGRAFCSGADLSANLTKLPDVDELVDIALLKSMFFPKPIIAAIDGACVAGGFELALGCDIRICTPEALFGLPEPRWGIFPSGGGVRKLGIEIGYARASELLLTGRLFGAEEALAVGLVSAIVPAEQLLEKALAIARQVGANSPAATSAIKRYLHTVRKPSEENVALERELTLATRQADADEGIAAFLEKREPQYGPQKSKDNDCDVS